MNNVALLNDFDKDSKIISPNPLQFEFKSIDAFLFGKFYIFALIIAPTFRH